MELLNEDWQRELIAQPELGMGYQDVAIKLRDGETRYGTAFNAEFLLYSENQRRFWRGLANHSTIAHAGGKATQLGRRDSFAQSAAT
jgi:hypothetical protein